MLKLTIQELTKNVAAMKAAERELTSFYKAVSNGNPVGAENFAKNSVPLQEIRQRIIESEQLLEFLANKQP